MKKTLTLLALVAGLLATLPGYSSGQTSRRWTPALVLATLTYSESGPVSQADDATPEDAITWVDGEDDDGPIRWTGDSDMRAIHAMLLRNAEMTELSYVAFARQYARHVIGGVGTIGRPWLRDLRPNGDQPDGWPLTVWARVGDNYVNRPHAPWAAFRTRWLATYTRALTIIDFELEAHSEWGACAEPPDDWGSPTHDHARAVRLGLIQLTCTGTDNEFWRRPSRT